MEKSGRSGFKEWKLVMGRGGAEIHRRHPFTDHREEAEMASQSVWGQDAPSGRSGRQMKRRLAGEVAITFQRQGKRSGSFPA